MTEFQNANCDICAWAEVNYKQTVVSTEEKWAKSKSKQQRAENKEERAENEQ